eukprot:CAMPEP_0196813250 /NCGR_PEP_ID=MMETSP1362-20130617/35118_1 /TAXON_ID=163516 /ORGANISM="Leptocylindrus danicus, Strain CCMP1856" /LENGTH=210 /DNA_ID=CAMNT_0042189363 /DNA_START=73 /DNA_END=702 /DNA_ORIENTATION=-
MTNYTTNDKQARKAQRKQLRFASAVTTNDAATPTKQSLTAEEKEQLWYNSRHYNAFAQHSKDLVRYAVASNVEDYDDESDYWAQMEYALNMHGHSVRGLEKVPGMPLAEKRDEKRELAIYGVLEALKNYKGDDAQIGMIASRLSSFSVKVALEAGDNDEVATICFPTDKELKACNSAVGAVDVEISNSGRPMKKTRRGSPILDALKVRVA